MDKKLLYFNALFDLELGGLNADSVQRSAAEMTLLFAPMGESSDRVLLDVHVEDTYWKQLESYGLATPAPIYFEDCTGYTSEAWGWNENSIHRLQKTGALCHAPDPTIVRTVNSRKFCSEIGIQYGLGVPNSTFCSSLEQLNVARTLFDDHFPVVIKPAFGSSGYGFVHLCKPDDFNQLTNTIFALHKGIVIEPWCKKLYDISSVCQISQSGGISTFRHQRAITNSRGTFNGIYLVDNDPVITQWIDKLETASLIAAREVTKFGYFGTLGFDSFIYEENGKEKLAAIIEINARHVMSDIAHAIRIRCAPNKHCFFRLLNKKRFRLPKSYDNLQKILHNVTFKNGHGCMVVTPLILQHGKEQVQPSRNAFFIAADSEQELWNIDGELRSKTVYR